MSMDRVLHYVGDDSGDASVESQSVYISLYIVYVYMSAYT